MSLFEMELYQRWGHTNPNTGRRYAKTIIQQVVYNPQFWGHTGRYYDGLDIGHAWVHEEDVAPPEGVELYRHTIPPVWTGEQAERARAELCRRETFATNSRPNQRTAFAGLLVCGECGYALSIRGGSRRLANGETKRYARWLCSSKSSGALNYTGCNRKSIADSDVREYVDLLLRAILQTGDLTALTPPSAGDDERRDLDSRLTALRQDYADTISLQRLARTLPEKTRHQETLDSLVEQIDILEKAQTELLPDNREGSLSALHRLQNITVDGERDRFWRLQPGEQNQLLHALFGKARLMIINGEIAGAGKHQRKQPVRRRRKG